jgi:preprotein translocase subunit SecG
MVYSLIGGLLTVILIVDCLLLVLLVLIQLPKKDAGAGLAFGAGATDALFGAGSGNTLTRITKYAAGIFFGLSLVLGVMNSHAHSRAGNLKALISKAPPVPQSAAPGAAETPEPAAAGASAPISLTTLGSNAPGATAPATTSPAKTGTVSNAPVAPPK